MKLAHKLAAVIGVASMVAMSACTTGDEAASSAAGGGDGKVEKVGLLLQDVSNPFFAAMQTRMQEEAKTQGFELNVQDGRLDLGTQNDQIDAMIQQGTDLILLNAVDSKGIASAVQRAQQAGIPVIAVDVDADGAKAAVTTDNVMAGKLACEALVEKIGGSGNILVIEGTPTSAPQDRVKGCDEVLKANPGIKVVARQAGRNDRASGLNLATDMLTANKDVKGIFAINDPEALGADEAVQQAGLKGITIVGVDAAPEAVTAMKDANSNLWATSAQNPGEMVVKAYEIGKGIVEGKEPAERVTLMEPSIVTRDTVKDYKGW
ncbi:MAG: ABC transporter substrate-binding protein [Actinomycetaceae bacterium]|nr:ABC transporter substrate-binding protein [Actinomycetaceae bacterium]